LKTISGGLAAHLAQPVTTLATLWKITRRDATVFGFTDHDQPITYQSVIYEAASGYSATDIKSNSALSVDNLDVTGLIDSSTLTEADLLAGLWDYATVAMYLVNYADLSQGALTLRTGKIGEITVRRTTFIAELRGLAQYLQQEVGQIFSAACRADLGDARCGVTLASYTVTSTVTGSTDRRTFTDSARAEAADYFNGGLLTWTSGANDGLQMEIKDFGAGVFTLVQPMPYAITPTDGD